MLVLCLIAQDKSAKGDVQLPTLGYHTLLATQTPPSPWAQARAPRGAKTIAKLADVMIILGCMMSDWKLEEGRI